MSAQVRSLTNFFACMFGPMIWAAHFFTVYAAESVACMTASPAATMRVTVLAVTAVALAAIALLFVLCMRASRDGDAQVERFMRVLSGWLATLSAPAIVVVAMSVWRLTPCMSPAG